MVLKKVEVSFMKSKNCLSWIGFWHILFWTGIIVVPVLGTVGPVFMACGVIVPIAGVIKLVGYLFHFEVPFIMFQVGSVILHPILVFLLSILIGIALFVGGKIVWKVLLKYFDWIKEMKKESNKNI